MATVLHKNLTGTDLHEPKGADAAAANAVYVADGAGSGTWFVLRPIGEMIDCFDLTEPTGYLFCDGDTIGNGSSNATARANADTLALFTKLWAIGDTYGTLAIFTSAGAASTFGSDAATDFAANKAIALPDVRERVTAGWDNKNNISRLLTDVDGADVGDVGGAESVALTLTNLPSGNLSHTLVAASHTHSVTASGTTSTNGDHDHSTPNAGGTSGASAGGSARADASTGSTSTNGAHTHSVTVSGTAAASGTLAVTGTIPLGGSDTAHSNVQPTFICTKLIFYGA